MKKIDISTPKHPDTFSLVDDYNFTRLNQWKWIAVEPYKGLLYAARSIQIDGKQRRLYMHNEIMPPVKGTMTDHQNGNGVDNQRHNLRRCTNAENGRNRGIQSNNTSGYKGVTWNIAGNKWKAQIMYEGEGVYLGAFTCLIKAAKAYDTAALKYHGEFANLNFHPIRKD
jgi:hypothetical protein